jgi:clan AA aspartic protease (TIGR02281 family)
MGVSASARFRPLRAALFAGFTLAALAGIAAAEPLSDGVNAYGRKDYATTKRLLRPLAERGSAIAQFYLGLVYERGKSVSESEAEAVSWFRKAAEQGLAASQAALGTRYFIGWGVPQNYAEAMNWSLKAAKQGNPSAQAILGTIYESGYGVQQNSILAYMWFTVSAHDPDFEPSTRRNLDEIARHLSAAQIATAKSLAQQCLQTGYVDCTQAPQVARRDDGPQVSRRDDGPQVSPHDDGPQVVHRDDDAAAATAPGGNPPSRTRVPLRTDRGISFVPVEINGTLKLDFALDSGASDVSVPADVFSTLKRTSTVKDGDLIGQQSYVLADGSTTQSSIFKIRSLKIGDLVVEDVKASVTPSHASLLLGQSFLERFKSWSIDNTTHELLLELRENR